jgi:hypothetical protein
LTTSTPDRTYRQLFWGLLAAVTLGRLFLAGQLGLGVDEGHYLLYARHLAWGYFDHPPMVGFLAALTTPPGENLVLVRLGPIVCWALSVVLLRQLALALYREERVAFWSSFLLLCVPLLHLTSVALLPDAPLNLFWCITLLAGWHAIRNGRWAWWVLAGLAMGGALLSKYHGVLLPACLGLYLLTSRQDRNLLRSPKPYVAVLLMFLVFLPNIIWNQQNDWVSYAFQLAHGGGRGFRVTKLLENIGGQLAAASPILLGVLVASWAALLKERPVRDADRFVLCTSLPVFVFFCAIGLKGKLLPHWTAVGWWTGVIAVAAVLLRKLSGDASTARRWKAWGYAGAGLGLFMAVMVYVALAFPIIPAAYNGLRGASLRIHRLVPAIPPMPPFEPKMDVSNDLYGWDRIGEQVEALRAAMPRPDRTFVFGHRFFTTSVLAPHLHRDTVATSLHPKMNQYQLWFDPAAHTDWDALYVDEDRFWKGPDRYASLFQRLDENPVAFDITRRGRVARSVRIYRFFGFKGHIEEP